MNIQLSNKEQHADRILSRYKAEFIASRKEHVPYDAPVLTDSGIWNSNLYHFCKRLPKGGDLHVHGGALLPLHELLEYLRSREDILLDPKGKEPGMMYYKDNIDSSPAHYITVRDALDHHVITEEQFLKYWTTAGVVPGQRPWDFFENLFSLQGALNGSPDVIKSNYYDSFKYYYECGIIHCQCRVLFFGSHEDAEGKAGAILEAYEEFHREHPDFCASIIGIGLKSKNLPMELTEMLYDNAMYLAGCERFQHAGGLSRISDSSGQDFMTADHSRQNAAGVPKGPFIIGWDLVNEEDISRPLEDFAWCLSDFKEKHEGMVLTLHAGESLDPSNHNVKTALSYGVDRIGHGLNFYRYPELLGTLSEKNICLEVCPISNQGLGFVPDLRNHPAREYLMQGVPMVLGSDNPGLQEHTALVDDFFMAILSWNLSLSDVKSLCYNSLFYCGLDETRKNALIKIWEKQWDEFITEIFSKCSI